MRDHEGTSRIDYDDFSMKTKLILKRISGIFGTLKFEERTCFNTILGFISYWDSNPSNAIQSFKPGVYVSDEV